jgi:hypothetical protein
MPKKIHPKKTRAVNVANLDELDVAFLTDGEYTFDDMREVTLLAWRSGLDRRGGDKDPRKLWAKYRDYFLPRYIEEHPGERPIPWWLFDAPRMEERFDAWFDGTLPAWRQRLGGKGETAPATVPRSTYGIPNNWDLSTIDPEDPPVFESQAAYLDRRGLLTDEERRVLKDALEKWEPEVLDFKEEED